MSIHLRRFFLGLVLVLPFVTDAMGGTQTGGTTRDWSGYHLSAPGHESTLVSGSSSLRFKATAAADTFVLFGGPGTDDGKFQSNGFGPDRQGWIGVDLTDQPPFWHVSTFCSANLNDHGSGNLAMWAGVEAENVPGWATPPGYGNNWNTALEWRGTVGDPSAAQTVDLSFAFNMDTEPNYDFFSVEYDSAGTTATVFRASGNNSPFAAPGVQYPGDVPEDPIRFGGNDYGGLTRDQIVLRLRFTSDVAWSDEDGRWPTTCGAAIVDDIRVTYDDGSGSVVSFSDFDTTNDWDAIKSPFVGDFSDVFPLFQDSDPCRDNPSPSIGFIDFGQCPRNAGNNHGEPPCETTGGSISSQWSYGIPGGWVVNYSGGLTFGAASLANQVWSPPIAWDLPGTGDDDASTVGAFFRYSVWSHLQVTDGIFYVWHVRTSRDGGQLWNPWRDRGDFFFDFVDRGSWINRRHEIGDLVVVDGQPPTHVQIALGVIDMASLFGFSGNDATPSPLFDNVRLAKYEVGGPVLAGATFNIFMDSFPQLGTFNFDTPQQRETADIRLDIRDVSSGDAIVPGDSLVLSVVPVIAGTSVTEVEMHWRLDKNPFFDTVRVQPPGSSVIAGGAANGWDQWAGVEPGQFVTVGGDVIPDRYFFDLPDEDFFHPGDVLRYYIRAGDNEGRVSTLPRDLAGFETGVHGSASRYFDLFTVHGLPSVADDGQGGWTQPSVLLVNDSGVPGGMNIYYRAMGAENGWRRGLEWDMFSKWAPTARVSNGIGSLGAHGATPDQLSGYDVILYFGANLTTLMSDGTDNVINDKSDDIGTLATWFQQDADRFIAHFGDNIASGLTETSPNAGTSYVQTLMGVDLLDNAVRDEIDGQTAPLVTPPEVSCFQQPFVAYGGCLGINDFDNIAPLGGATAVHQFNNWLGTPFPGPGRAASVVWDRVDGGGNRKVSFTFPYGLVYVWNRSHDNTDPEFEQASVRSILLSELIESCFDRPLGDLDPVTTPAGLAFRGAARLSSFPNPFNPATTVSFDLSERSQVSVAIYTLRGERVVTLHDGFLDGGRQSLVWRGRDQHDAPVASGVYLVEVKTGVNALTSKLVLLQ